MVRLNVVHAPDLARLQSSGATQPSHAASCTKSTDNDNTFVAGAARIMGSPITAARRTFFSVGPQYSIFPHQIIPCAPGDASKQLQT